MRFRSETIWARYGVAILNIALATGLRLALKPVLGSDYPFATIFLAIVFSSWYGGFGPTLLAALLGAFAAAYFLGPNNPARAGANPWLGALFYWGMCLAISLLGGMFRVARRRVARQLEQIHNEREHLRATLSSIGDAVIVTDDHGRITLLNAVAESLTGWTAGEAQGQALGEVFRIVNEHSRAIVESPVDRVLREGVVVGLANHTVLIRKDGASRPIDDSAAPIRDHAGRLIGVVLVFRDVTERRAADDVLTRLAAIVQSSDDAIVGKTVDGMITSWNAAAERIYGYAADEVIGRPFSILVPPNRGREVEQNLTRLARGERIDHYETQRQRKDGTLVDVSMSHSPLRDREGVLTAVAVIARDITAQREAQEKLLQNERELADFFENAAVGLHWVNSDGLIIRANRAELELLGYAAEEYVGRHIADFHADADTIEDILTRLKKGESIVEFPARLRCKDGSIKDVLIDSSVLWQGDEFIHTRCFTRDVTDRRRAERTAHFLVEASEALASVIDLRSTLEKVTCLAVPRFADWCCVKLINADRSLASLVMSHNDPARLAAARELFERAPPDFTTAQAPLQILHSGVPQLVPEIGDDWLAAAFPQAEHCALVKEFGLRSYLGVPLVIRERKLGLIEFFSAESGRSFDARDVEVAEDLARRTAVAIENAELYQALRDADRKKDDFLALLAHELRNPLAPIQSALQILKLPTVDAKIAGEAREVAERQLVHLTRLVDDLLDVSRIMRGKIVLRKERVDLSAIVNRAVETIRPAIDAERHELIVELPETEVTLEADIVRMSQALANLLSNAAKYTPAGGRIWLTAALDDGLLTVRVRDTGIGIAAETLPHLFDMFMQVAPGTARSQGGLGIGLTLVKSLIEMHGGTVAVQSEGLGRGSEFSLRLPAPTLKAQASAEPGQEKAEVPIAARRLLVVDDNVDAAQSLAVLLRLYGHQVRVAHGGEDALAAVAAEPPELILLDIGMPGMNGYEVASHLRKQFTSEQLTLVALTGWGQEQDRRRSKEAGFDHHLTKPVELATLRKVLARSAEGVPSQL